MNLEPVIGLEVHVHLRTNSKLFCGCMNASESEKPNQFICPVCMGFPGTLPVLNRQAVEWTILAGLALGCRVATHSTFARKSYFYPDLPKGYQISQYEEPLCVDGEVHVFAPASAIGAGRSPEDQDDAAGVAGHQEVGSGAPAMGERLVRIQRVHLEEDAAKNVHEGGATLVDHNRAGTPLIEIVTHPDLRSPTEAKAFLEDLQRTVRYVGISNADMEKGDLRVDANVSLRNSQLSRLRPASVKATAGRQGFAGQATLSSQLGPKTEIKNLNSFRAVERALAYEVERQTKLWEAGRPPAASSTRGWAEEKQETTEQRVKEEEADYRYFPEPDIPPLVISEALVEKLRRELPELPHAKEERFRRQYGLTAEAARVLTGDRDLAAYAENVFSEVSTWERDRQDVSPRDTSRLWELATNYIVGDVRATLAAHRGTISETGITPENLAELILMLHRAEVNRNAVPEVLRIMHETGGDPSTIVQERGLAQVSDADTLRRIVQDVIASSPAEVDKVRAGKVQVLEFLVGQVMARTKGRANPDVVRGLFREELGLSAGADTPPS